MSLPIEVIQLIVRNLTNGEQYKCLTVNKAWHEATHHMLYRTIRINTRFQLKSLFTNLSCFKRNRLLIRQLYLKKNKGIVGITSKELDDLANLCPYLESIDFDSSIWKYVHYPSNLLDRQLTKLPQFNLNTPLSSFYEAHSLSKIKELDLHGELVSKLFENQNLMLFQLLQNTSMLKRLCLNSHQLKSHVIPISLHDLDMVHRSVPLLEYLELSGSFHFHANPTDDFIILPSYHLHHLKLKAIIPPSLVLYIAQKYPKLITLDLEFLLHYYHTYGKAPSTADPSPTLQNVFCNLLDNCRHLCRLEIDSNAAKEFMTTEFFQKTRQRMEINIKNLPYHLITRDQPFFDILMQHGQHLITGLGTEIMDSLVTIITPLSHFTQLTELTLCCGHPYFDCPLDLILGACRRLNSLTMRSAHVLIQTQQSDQEKQHPLKSLHLSTVSFSPGVFHYLGKHCHKLNQLSFYECDLRDEKNKIEIHMPENNFESILMNGIRLNNIPLESHAWVPNTRILSIETTNKQKKWYHVYNSNFYFPEHPKTQKLNKRKREIAEHYYQYGWINNKKYLQKAMSLKRKQEKHHYLYTRSSKEWEQDLFFGHISIQCNSIKQWELICNTTYNEF